MPGEAPVRRPLGRQMRLKEPRDFSRVRLQGERLVNGCLIINWHRLPAGSATRLGVVTGRKIGGAVARNRARRLMREAFRLHQHELTAPADLVLVARPSIAGRPFAAVERDFLAGLRRAGMLGQHA